ncbi:MAG: ABC transporter substrate-binding protein [Gemmatimonadales bacterium]
MRSRGWQRPFLLLAAIVGGACAGGGGAGAAPGFVGDTVTVGALLPLSDAVAVIGRPIAIGLQAYAAQVNARGGIAGRYWLKVLEEDITYANPSTGAQKYQKIKSDVALLASVVGTDQVNGLLPLLSEDSLIAIPTTFDAEWVRQPNLLPWGPPYQVWTTVGAAYYLDHGGRGKTICAMTLATGYGEAALEGLEFASGKLGFELGVKVTFRQDDQDFVAPITQLKNGRCDAVFLASLPGVTGKVLGAAAQMGFEPQWIAQSPAWHSTLLDSPLRDYYRDHLWLLASGTEWGDTTAAGSADMIEAVSRYAPDQKPDLYASTGYLLGLTAGALLERALASGDLSRTGLLRALDGLGTVPYGGLWAEYRYGPPARREPPRVVSIFRIDPDGPWGVRLLAKDYTTPAANDLTF